jgi:hypothetical protein
VQGSSSNNESSVMISLLVAERRCGSRCRWKASNFPRLRTHLLNASQRGYAARHSVGLAGHAGNVGCGRIAARPLPNSAASLRAAQEAGTGPEQSNADQLAFWNGPGGPTWVARQEHTDITLALVSEALLALAAPRGLRVRFWAGGRWRETASIGTFNRGFSVPVLQPNIGAQMSSAAAWPAGPPECSPSPIRSASTKSSPRPAGRRRGSTSSTSI